MIQFILLYSSLPIFMVSTIHVLCKQQLLQTKVISNFLFLLPSIIYLVSGNYILSIFPTLVFLSSTLYHYSNETKFLTFDKIAAYSLIVVNSYAFYMAGIYNYFFFMAFVICLGGLYIFIKLNKDDWEWHSACAIVSTLAGYSYIMI